MITVLGTDITIFVIFAIGFFIGHIIGQNKRLRKENVKLKSRSTLKTKLETGHS